MRVCFKDDILAAILALRQISNWWHNQMGRKENHSECTYRSTYEIIIVINQFNQN
jgi:hypothetical protein